MVGLVETSVADFTIRFRNRLLFISTTLVNHQMSHIEQTEPSECVSKTQKKKQMNALQDLGAELTKLNPETLKKIMLPEELQQAVLDYKKMTSNGALKRQIQYIGRLMRAIDPTPIENYLATLKGENVAHNAYIHRLEALREQLIDNDQALTDLIDKKPNIDVSALRTLIRNARKEKALNKPPKAFRALFQQLKIDISEHDAI